MKGILSTLAGFTGIIISCYYFISHFGNGEQNTIYSLLFVIASILFILGIRWLEPERNQQLRPREERIHRQEKER